MVRPNEDLKTVVRRVDKKEAKPKKEEETPKVVRGDITPETKK